MCNQIGSLEKTVVRGGDKSRKLEYVRVIDTSHAIVWVLIRLFVSSSCPAPSGYHGEDKTVHCGGEERCTVCNLERRRGINKFMGAC